MILDGTTIKIEKGGHPSEKIFVIAMNYKRFDQWCRSKGINRMSPMVVYVRRASDLFRQVNGWFIDLGTTNDQAMWVYDMMEAYVRTRGFREIPRLRGESMAKKPVIEDRRAWNKLTTFWNGRDKVPADKQCGDQVTGPGGSKEGSCVLDGDHKNGEKHASNIPHADKDGHTGPLASSWRDKYQGFM